MKIHTKNAGETARLGEKIAGCRKSGDDLVIYLSGDLGAGKTTLARGFLGFFGFRRIKSPTYPLLESYAADDFTIHHLDCYRLSDAVELAEIGIFDLHISGDIQIVEWPEKGGGTLHPADLSIYIKIENHGRIFAIEAHSENGKNLIRCLGKK